MGISVIGAATGGGGAQPKEVRFTADGTWTVPDGVEYAEVTVVGAGGGGGKATTSTNYAGSGGGAGGDVVTKTIPVAGDMTVKVGAGGAVGIATGTSYSNGKANLRAGETGGFSYIGTAPSIIYNLLIDTSLNHYTQNSSQTFLRWSANEVSASGPFQYIEDEGNTYINSAINSSYSPSSFHNNTMYIYDSNRGIVTNLFPVESSTQYKGTFVNAVYTNGSYFYMDVHYFDANKNFISTSSNVGNWSSIGTNTTRSDSSVTFTTISNAKFAAVRFRTTSTNVHLNYHKFIVAPAAVTDFTKTVFTADSFYDGQTLWSIPSTTAFAGGGAGGGSILENRWAAGVSTTTSAGGIPIYNSSITNPQFYQAGNGTSSGGMDTTYEVSPGFTSTTALREEQLGVKSVNGKYSRAIFYNGSMNHIVFRNKLIYPGPGIMGLGIGGNGGIVRNDYNYTGGNFGPQPSEGGFPIGVPFTGQIVGYATTVGNNHAPNTGHGGHGSIGFAGNTMRFNPTPGASGLVIIRYWN